MHLPKPTAIVLILPTPGSRPTEMYSWESAATVLGHWAKALPEQERGDGVKVRAEMAGGMVLEIAVSLKGGEVPDLEWSFSQALLAALGQTPPAPADSDRVTLHSFNWNLISESIGMRVVVIREREVVLRYHPLGGKEQTFLVTDNGGEFCVFEQKLEDRHTGVAYTSHAFGKVGDLTTAYRIKSAIEGSQIDWKLDLDAAA